ncbi:cold-shock protein [Streptosporangiaceae bacterium NEAU-GS5]|nr:cold-shock protein [Streptosporangiaceae bacterium NEAU-GS5]
MAQGTVKWFDPAKGYGFIATDDGRDVFVHYSAITMDDHAKLVPGRRVEFDITQGRKGPQAEAVRVLVGNSGIQDHVSGGGGDERAGSPEDRVTGLYYDDNWSGVRAPPPRWRASSGRSSAEPGSRSPGNSRRSSAPGSSGWSPECRRRPRTPGSTTPGAKPSERLSWRRWTPGRPR